MDKFIKIPGLQHISEDILKLLDKNILIECRLVNSSWKTVLEQPRFWLKKFKLEKLPLDGQESLKALVKKLEDDQMAKNSANDLLENFNLENKLSGLAQRLRNDELSKEFVLLMIKIYKGKENNLLKIAVRLKGGYTYPIIPNELKISRNSLMDTNKYQELIKFIIKHENLNSKLNLTVSIFSGKHGGKSFFVEHATPIHLAVLFGFTDVFEKLNNKRLRPLDGWSAISVPASRFGCCFELAAMGGHLNTLKYLVKITDTSIAPVQKGTIWCTPISTAAEMGHLDIVKYFVDTFSTSVLFPRGRTELRKIIGRATRFDTYLEVAKYLEEHCKNTFRV